MKPFAEIKKDKRFQANLSGADGGNGWVTYKGRTIFVVYSNGGEWDHVSASYNNRCPSWEEMCAIKDIFFYPDECCVEYHPAKADYVNVQEFCLHIWKPQKAELPRPPRYFV